jgi:hypothetical protein
MVLFTPQPREMTVLQCMALLAVIASVGLWACTWEPSLAARATANATGKEASDLRLAGGSGVPGPRSDIGGRLQRREHRSK